MTSALIIASNVAAMLNQPISGAMLMNALPKNNFVKNLLNNKNAVLATAPNADMPSNEMYDVL